MIQSIAVVPHTKAKPWPRGAEVALITITTPGCSVAGQPALRALHLSFDTLAGELEAASLRLPKAAPAVPFTIEHAQALAGFLSALQRVREPVDLMLCESEGYVRSVTVARWAARRIGCPLHEPAQAAALASCVLMDGVLNRLPAPARELVRREPQAADCAVQP